jgi:hypothetical protein
MKSTPVIIKGSELFMRNLVVVDATRSPLVTTFGQCYSSFARMVRVGQSSIQVATNTR